MQVIVYVSRDASCLLSLVLNRFNVTSDYCNVTSYDRVIPVNLGQCVLFHMANDPFSLQPWPSNQLNKGWLHVPIGRRLVVTM